MTDPDLAILLRLKIKDNNVQTMFRPPLCTLQHCSGEDRVMWRTRDKWVECRISCDFRPLSPGRGGICKISGQLRRRFRIFFAKSHIRGCSAKPSHTAYRRGCLALHVQEVRSRVGQLDPVFLNLEVHPVRVTARRERRTLAHTALH